MNGAEISALAPLVWLTLGGVAVLLVDAVVRRRSMGHLTFVSVVFLALAGLSAWGDLGHGGVERVFGGAMIIDDFTRFFELAFVLIALGSIAVGAVYYGRERRPVPEFYPLILFSCVGMGVMVGANDLITLFLGLETMSIALYVLAASQRHSLFSNEAGFKYLILGAFSSAFLLYGMALLYGSSGTLQLSEMARQIKLHPELRESVLFLAGWGLLVVGLGFKVALVPFHMWTPDVYEGAPAPVTGFMAAGVKAASFAAFLRVAWTAAPIFSGFWGDLLQGLAVVTMVFGNVVALAQTSFKRMLAYSAIAHAGYLLVGVIASSPQPDDAAARGVLFYLFAYALMNVGAFALVTLVSRRDEEMTEMNGLAGLAKRNPVAAATVAVFMLSLAGIPPTAGFWGKLYVFEAAVRQGYVALAVIAMLNSAVAMFYYMRVIVIMYMRDPEQEAYDGDDLQVGAVMAVAAVALLWIGLFPGPTAELARQGAAALAASF